MPPTPARGTQPPRNGYALVAWRLDQLEGTIRGLSFVRTDVWQAEKTALLAEHKAIREDVESLRTNIRALIYMLLTAIASAITYAVATALVK